MLGETYFNKFPIVYLLKFSDFSGRWKMLHYFARDFFAPVIVSSRLSQAGDLTIYIISDLHRPLKELSITLNIYKWQSMMPVSVQNFTNLSVVCIY